MSVILLIVAAMITACGVAPNQSSSAPPSEDSGGPKIMVMDAWSRPSPMVAGNGAIYMTLMNEGAQGDVLLSVETDVAEVIELHESKMENDVMKMSPVAQIDVPAGGSAKLEPGGKHVMLINLKEELKPGEKIGLTLNFETSGPIDIEAEIHEAGQAMGSGDDHEMDDDPEMDHE